MTITQKQRDILRHSLGLNYSLKQHRNFFCTGPDSDDWQAIETLVAAGLMRRGANGDSGLVYFHVTAEGKIEATKEPSTP